ncbi:MAG: STAS domain-containing protein [Silvibacterium sp.]
MSNQTPTDPLSLIIERNGSTAVVKCHGKLVAGVSDYFYNSIRQLIPDTKKIVLDLSDLTRMDSMGLGALVRLYVSAKSAGCKLELINVGKQVQNLLGITDLWSVFATIGERGIKMY